MTTNAQSVPAQADVPSWRLLATLGGAGAIAGLLIVLAFIVTRPPIERYRAMQLRAAIEEVLRAPARADTLFLVGGALTDRPPAASKGIERIYRGLDGAGRTTGYAIVASEAGFQDQIQLMFGWSAASGEVLGIRILSTKETPGLGDKIEKPYFTSQFAGAVAPLLGVKDSTAKGTNASAIVMITGATISSRTVIREINNAVVRWRPLVATYESQRAEVK